jgi:NAD(P)-dependent dehydrogenase (short-subunit alcohol dehydrogenase family)
MIVTRAILPVMRRRRSGHVITLSSVADLLGQEFCSAYAAAKVGLEGWMESLAPEVAPFGINTTVVEPRCTDCGPTPTPVGARRYRTAGQGPLPRILTFPAQPDRLSTVGRP